MSIEDDIFLEMLLLRIRGESIKFASHEKKTKTQWGNSLKTDIEELESSETLPASSMELLQDKKTRTTKIKGC